MCCQVISIFNEERDAEVDKQREGLTLAKLFAKPRPVWLAPALIATFGDAFIGKPLYLHIGVIRCV